MNAPLALRTTRPRTQLLVVEATAAPWSHLAERTLRPGETWTLPAPGGKLADWASALTIRHASLQTAALLSSPSVARSEHELAQRARVARLLLKHLMSTGSGELLLVTAASASRDVRQELLALVDVFLTELAGAPLVISALFLEPRRVRASAAVGSGLPAALGHGLA